MRVTLFAVLILCSVALAADAPGFKSAHVRQVQQQYETARNGFRTMLERAIVEAKQKDDADELAKLQDALAEISSESEGTADSIGRVRFKGHWYKLVEVRVSFQQAEALCNAIGGHLVSVTSPAEQAFVEKMAGNRQVWLGATDHGSEGRWRWVSGEKSDFSDWYPGEPNNVRNSEHYLSISGQHGGKWNDVSADSDRVTAFICEWE